MIIEIDDIPPSLNQIIGLAKAHWGAYAGLKKKWKEKVYKAIPIEAEIFNEKVKIHIIYIFPDKRKRDYDNYMGAYKLIGDGLVGQIITDDSQEYIESLTVKFDFQKGVRKTIIEVIPVEVSK